MTSSTGTSQHVSSIVKLNWLLILTAALIVCCSSNNIKPIDIDQLLDYQMTDHYFPTVLSRIDSNVVERAAPRLGRAAPRLGRASPRLGRRVVDLMLSRINHIGQYYNADHDITSNHPYDVESSIQERRAAPRLGRAIEFDQQ